MLALGAAVIFNLVGALVMDLLSQGKGIVLVAMVLTMLLSLLPLLWVPDPTAWIRENPLSLGVIILIAAYMRQRYKGNWPLLAVAVILGVAQILISFF